MVQVLIIPMLALVPWSVEGESVTGCCAVTFYNLLIISELFGARRTVRFTDGMRRPVSAGCDTLPRFDVLKAQRKGDRL
jgi:hypothetical protein